MKGARGGKRILEVPPFTTSLRCTQTWADYLLPKAVAA